MKTKKISDSYVVSRVSLLTFALLRRRILIFIFVAFTFVSGVFVLSLNAEPTDEKIISEIEYFSIKAFGDEGYKQRFDRFYARKPSRLEWARYFNEVAWRIETKGIYLNSDEEKRFDDVVKYFDREYLLINTASLLENVPRLKLGAEFSLNTEYGWGEDVAASVLSVYQQLRLALEARRKNILGKLVLRNFGFWGVNDYSSGSIGIDFKTSDPPSIEELWVESSGDIFKFTVGRRYFKYGFWGLAVNRVYLPIDMAELAFKKRILGEKTFFEARFAGCSKYENVDYFASSFELSGEDGGFNLGVSGAISSSVSEKVMTDAGVDENEQSASLWGGVAPFEGFAFKAESGVYKKVPDASAVYPFILETDIIPSEEMEFSLRYASIPDMRFPSYSSARAPLDYYPKEYIGTRFSPKTRGFNGILSLKYASPFVVELEYTTLNGIDEDVRYNKGAVRGLLLVNKGSGKSIFDRLVFEISTTALDTTESDSAEYRFISQCAFKF